jgi:acetyl-CoA carboxylase biotin carboxyl carrier protein
MEVTINSPLSGTVAQIVVSEGDAVKEGDTVAVLESMKMEIPIESTAAGTVSKVEATAGGFAREGDALVVINSEG